MASIQSVQSGDWTDELTWDGGVAPVSGDDAIIYHDVLVDDDVACDNLSVEDGGELELDSGHSVACVFCTWTSGGAIVGDGDIDCEAVVDSISGSFDCTEWMGTLYSGLDDPDGYVQFNSAGDFDLVCDVAGTLDVAGSTASAYPNLTVSAATTYAAEAEEEQHFGDIDIGSYNLTNINVEATMVCHGSSFDGFPNSTYRNHLKVRFTSDATAECYAWNSGLWGIEIDSGVTVTPGANGIRAGSVEGSGDLADSANSFVLSVTAYSVWSLSGTVGCPVTIALGEVGDFGALTFSEPILFSTARALSLLPLSYATDRGVQVTVPGVGGTGPSSITVKGRDGSDVSLTIQSELVGSPPVTFGHAGQDYGYGDLHLSSGGEYTLGAIALAGTGAPSLTFDGTVRCDGLVTLANIAFDGGRASVALSPGVTLDGDSAASAASAGMHLHGGTLQNFDVDGEDPVYRFGPDGTDVANGAGVVAMPSPLAVPIGAAA